MKDIKLSDAIISVDPATHLIASVEPINSTFGTRLSASHVYSLDDLAHSTQYPLLAALARRAINDLEVDEMNNELSDDSNDYDEFNESKPINSPIVIYQQRSIPREYMNSIVERAREKQQKNRITLIILVALLIITIIIAIAYYCSTTQLRYPPPPISSYYR